MSRTGTQLVAVDDQGVAGYLLSADDSRAFEAWAEAEWWPPLRERYPGRMAMAPMPAWCGESMSRSRRSMRPSGTIPRTSTSTSWSALAGRVLDGGSSSACWTICVPEGCGRPSRRRLDNGNAIGFYGHLGFEVLDQEPGGLLMGIRLG